MTNDTNFAAKALNALADPTRRTIFEHLATAPAAVGELARSLPVSRPAVSQHLRVLTEAGLVRPTICGTRHIYRVDQSGITALRQWLDHFWNEKNAAVTTAGAPDPAAMRQV